MNARRLLLACWNLRLASLFMGGPIAGLVLLALIFGMSVAMRTMALGMIVFSLALFAILIKGEYDRLTRLPRR